MSIDFRLALDGRPDGTTAHVSFSPLRPGEPDGDHRVRLDVIEPGRAAATWGCVIGSDDVDEISRRLSDDLAEAGIEEIDELPHDAFLER